MSAVISAAPKNQTAVPIPDVTTKIRPAPKMTAAMISAFAQRGRVGVVCRYSENWFSVMSAL